MQTVSNVPAATAEPTPALVAPEPDRAQVFLLAALGEISIATARKILTFGLMSVKGEMVRARSRRALRALGLGDDGQPLAAAEASHP